ncbi:O-methyltransferase [Talaromyces stipitatus ATCC 10500]|uniref:O-methyltransferase n=1 Tax=Talaromyces stipitatus (strain ATCC 10500 / CBS 375.48 / QM 6759 / NRRL 1006) TaxID=441959 RepID=B8M1J9_TALSN|nr:O-methyltransferase [Talaromyces stipitatus ATCC 10500]EED22086.1 O-methyltransferase [Talaromyces stipitatus ATCC 10500]
MSGTLSAQAEALVSKIKELETSSNNISRADRLRLVQSLEKLTLQLKDPKDAIFDHLTNVFSLVNLRALLELEVPQNIPTTGSISATELAEKVKADASLIVRLMRILTVTGIFAMVGPDEYAHTPYSLAYIEGHEVDFLKLCCDEILVVTSRLPEYFRAVGARDTTSMTENPFTWGNGKLGSSFFEIISQDPRRIKQFDIAMSTQDHTLPVLGMYPFGEELINSPDLGNRALIVDIGGGRGQSLLQIKEKWPQLRGRMILQDRPVVLNSFPELPGIEKMPHNFFTQQPVRYAHAYYIRRCIHNWTDEHSIQILKVIVPSMAPDSRVLIGEMVVPEYNSIRPGGVEDMAPYWMDHNMFAFGGRERTKSDFEKLFAASGLKLVKVWQSEASSQAVLEARLADS